MHPRTFFIVALFSLCAPGGQVVAESFFASTSLKGPVQFFDENDQEATPFTYDEFQKQTKTRVFDLNNALRPAPPLTAEETGDDGFAYLVHIGTKYPPPLRLRLEFYGKGYDLREDFTIPTHAHLGEVNNPLKIFRRYPDRETRLHRLRFGMESEFSDVTIDTNLRLIEGLVNDPVGEGGADPGEVQTRYEDYKRAVLLMQKVINEEAPLSPDISRRIMELPDSHSFEILNASQQFQIYADFAYWFSRSKLPNQQIQSTLTHVGLARTFFEYAYVLAEETEETEPIRATPLISMLTELRELECVTTEGSEGWMERCLSALRATGNFDRTFSESTYQGILSTFATVVFTASTPSPKHKTECEYRARIAVELIDGVDMLPYWEDYIALAENAGEKRSKIKRTLERKTTFDRKADIAKTLERARDIVAYSAWSAVDFSEDADKKPGFSATCNRDFSWRATQQRDALEQVRDLAETEIQ